MADWRGDVRLVGGKLPEAGIIEVRFKSFDLPDDVPVDVLLAKGDKFERKFGDDRRRLVCALGVLELARAHVVAERFEVDSVLGLGNAEIAYEVTIQFAVDPRDPADQEVLARVIMRELNGRLELRSIQLELELDVKGAKALHRLRAAVASGELKLN